MATFNRIDSMSDSSAPARPLEQNAFDEWPDAVRALFDGSSLASKAGFTASLLTVDTSGHIRTSLLGVGELMNTSTKISDYAMQPIEIMTAVAVLYLLCNLLITGLFAALERRYPVERRAV